MISPGQQLPPESSVQLDVKSQQILGALQSASGRELIALLFRFGLAESFLRQLKEREIVFNQPNLSDPDEIHDQALTQYCESHQLDSDDDRLGWCRALGMSPEDLLSEAIHEWRRDEYRKQLLTASGESLFLRYKDKLDRVLYSLLRVQDSFQCQKIYYAIEANEISFSEAASRYSCGPESKTQGIVGPVDLTTPHPEISARLRTAQPGLLIGPFKADDWYTLVRLEYRFDSEYDDNTKKFLEDICFKSQVGQNIEPILQCLKDWVNTES